MLLDTINGVYSKEFTFATAIRDKWTRYKLSGIHNANFLIKD